MHFTFPCTCASRIPARFEALEQVMRNYLQQRLGITMTSLSRVTPYDEQDPDGPPCVGSWWQLEIARPTCPPDATTCTCRELPEDFKAWLEELKAEVAKVEVLFGIGALMLNIRVIHDVTASE